MKPLTVALDTLQGEDNCYYGSLLPTLEILMSKTLAQAIKTRFASVLDIEEALLAAVTLPKFKVWWLKEEDRRDALRTLLTTKRCASPCNEQDFHTPHTQASSRNENDFFDDEEDLAPYNSDTEVIEYLKSESQMAILNRFPTIKIVHEIQHSQTLQCTG